MKNDGKIPIISKYSIILGNIKMTRKGKRKIKFLWMLNVMNIKCKCQWKDPFEAHKTFNLVKWDQC